MNVYNMLDGMWEHLLHQWVTWERELFLNSSDICDLKGDITVDD